MRQMVAGGAYLSNGHIEPTRKRNGCQCKYKVRCFYSKGAFVVLFWNILVCLSCVSLIQLLTRHELSNLTGPYVALLFIPVVILAVAIPLSGWLADAKFGNYKVSKVVLIILFLGTVFNCVLALILQAFPTSIVFQNISFGIVVSLIGVGGITYFVISLQLGLDQMPDASASSITSFIAWFVLSLLAGIWAAETLQKVWINCIETKYQILLKPNFVQIWSLLVTLCMSIVLVSEFFLAPKWLTIEPNSPQSFKRFYQVLKFAVKHKAPVNRSALTYWEEDIPSRIDLGKAKYGGPFTTEQVEDVKTILRLLLISLSLWVVALSIWPHINTKPNIVNGTLQGLSVCTTNILYSFTLSSSWCTIIATILFEFAVYPLVRNKLPSTLKRIGCASFLITAVSLLCLILTVAHYFYTGKSALEWIAALAYLLMQGILIQVLATSVIEFVCAQSPYNMRGLLTGYMVFLIGTTLITGGILNTVVKKYCFNYSSIVSLSIKSVLGLIGFVLHCILAHWYKRRVRDDIYSPHRLVEEVYDRYLTPQTNAGRYGTGDS